MLDSGIDINAKDSRGDTALHHAVGRNYLAVVKVILEHGANPNARGWCARVPMMPTISGAASAPIISAFLEAGADSYAKDIDGHCPRTVYLSPDIQRLFVEHDAQLARGSIAQAFAEGSGAEPEALAARSPRGLSI